jgi:hypothetical protein
MQDQASLFEVRYQFGESNRRVRHEALVACRRIDQDYSRPYGMAVVKTRGLSIVKAELEENGKKCQACATKLKLNSLKQRIVAFGAQGLAVGERQTRPFNTGGI